MVFTAKLWLTSVAGKGLQIKHCSVGIAFSARLELRVFMETLLSFRSRSRETGDEILGCSMEDFPTMLNSHPIVADYTRPMA